MKNKIKDSANDVYYDIVDTMYDNLKNGDTLDEAINSAIDSGLTYADDVFELANKYLRQSDVIDMFIEELYNDLYSETDGFSTNEDITLDNGKLVTCIIDDGTMEDEEGKVSLDYDFDSTLEENLDRFKEECEDYYSDYDEDDDDYDDEE